MRVLEAREGEKKEEVVWERNMFLDVDVLPIYRYERGTEVRLLRGGVWEHLVVLEPPPPPGKEPDAARRLVGDFVVGVGSLNRRSLITTGALSLGVWIFELLALVAMFHAAAIDLRASEALVVMGAMSLSTLVPTAPGYIGTYQLVAALAMAAFGHSETLGIIAATGIQVFLFGGVTLVGVGALIIRSLARLQAGDTAD